MTHSFTHWNTCVYMLPMAVSVLQSQLNSCHTCGSQTFSPQFPDFIIYLLFLTVLGLCCCTDFPLVVASRGYSLVAVHGLLSAVASLVERGFWGAWASVVGHRLGCSVACGIFV